MSDARSQALMMIADLAVSTYRQQKSAKLAANQAQEQSRLNAEIEHCRMALAHDLELKRLGLDELAIRATENLMTRNIDSAMETYRDMQKMLQARYDVQLKSLDKYTEAKSITDNKSRRYEYTKHISVINSALNDIEKQAELLFYQINHILHEINRDFHIPRLVKISANT